MGHDTTPLSLFKRKKDALLSFILPALHQQWIQLETGRRSNRL